MGIGHLGVLVLALILCAGSSAASEPASHTKDARRSGAGNLVGHGGPVKALRVDAASGRALTGSFDYTMMVWDVSGSMPRLLHRLDGHEGAVNAVAFVPGSGGDRVLSAGDDGVVRLWDIAIGKPLHQFRGHESKVVGLSVSPDGRWAASAGWDRKARIWDLERLTAGPVLEGHRAPVNAVAFSRDGASVYTASGDGGIGHFRRTDGQLDRIIHSQGWGINVLERIEGGDMLLFGALNGNAGILDATTGDLVVDLKAHDRPVLAASSIGKPGLVVTGSGDGVIRVARAADGAPIEEYRNPFGPVWALAFSPGGDHLYYGGLDDFATLWQVSPRAPIEPIDGQFPRRFQLTAAADDPVAQGQLQFARKCSICHTLTPDGSNRAGPTLHNIFGRRIGTLPHYPYSPPLRALDIVWTEANVAKLFELGPDVLTPGSKMPLQRITDQRQRDELIAFLRVATVDDGSHRVPDSATNRDALIPIPEGGSK